MKVLVLIAFMLVMLPFVEMAITPIDSTLLLSPKRGHVCYGTLGCFTTNYPFSFQDGEITVLPQSPEIIQTKFELYTQELKTAPQVLDARNIETAYTVWTSFKLRPIKMIIHGFMSNPVYTPWVAELKKELLEYGDYNVIVVDWSKGNFFPYRQAVANARVVGAQIAELINCMIALPNITASDFHLIGHSLGAHISGYAGERVQSLGRISGLDPGGPMFETTDKGVRLDEEDAIFVDVIHTDTNYLGIKRRCGHVDMFPNLGREQPGCPNNVGSLTKFLESLDGLLEILETFTCSHNRVMSLYIESIRSSCSFLAVPCLDEQDFLLGQCTSDEETFVRMGFHADQDWPKTYVRSKYYLMTNSAPPFCLQ